MSRLAIHAVAVLSGILLGVLATTASAACENADHYMQAGVKPENKGVSGAIDCLASGLTERSTAPSSTDKELAGKILILASKLIGNGAPMAEEQKKTLGTGTAPATASLATPSQRPSTAAEVRSAAESIVCIARATYFGNTATDNMAVSINGTCAPATNAKEEILLASKIIGNG